MNPSGEIRDFIIFFKVFLEVCRNSDGSLNLKYDMRLLNYWVKNKRYKTSKIWVSKMLKKYKKLHSVKELLDVFKNWRISNAQRISMYLACFK